MSNGHDRDSASQVNPQTTHFNMPAWSIVQAAFTVGAPYYPEKGRFGIALWAAFLQCTTETVKDRLEEHSIPYRRDGADIVIDAEVYWSHLPECTTVTDTFRKRGGDRRKPAPPKKRKD